MFDDLIREQDVPWAASLMGLGPNGFAPVDGDESRFQAMRRLDSVDFEACPGSGKTTLLVAKLAVLAVRWPHRKQGICVLSHTNAARNEIGTKLGNSAAGLALMRYPHFVGTIHSFVNEYLALPWLRSNGLNVRCIDTQIALAKRWYELPYTTRIALERSHLTPAAMAYDGPDYTGGKVGKFGPHTPTGQLIIAARRKFSEQGYFCFDEMFVWANDLLDRRPEAAHDLRQRFPLVFIDEAQDNSEEQSALLHRIFCAGDGPVRRQRFGDSNQAIYAKPGLAGAETDPFPGAAVHPLPRSYRFSQSLADEVKGFGVTPQALVGAGPPPHIAAEPKMPAIFLFDDASVQSVLPKFGAHLVASFDAAALAAGTFTAVAGVHELDQNGRVPHAMGHYVPSYDPSCARRETAPDRFAQYLARARFETAGSRNFQLEFLSPLIGRADVELIIRSGNMRDLLAQLEAHTVDVVLANSAPQLDARSDLRSHLLAQQPVAIVRRPSAQSFTFRFPEDLQSQPILLPSLDSEIRVGFDRIVELAGVRPLIIAEVDDMAMLRLLARDGEGLALVPPIVVRDELAAGLLVEVCPIPNLSETFYAITQKRRFPNPLLADLLACAAKDK